MRYLFFLIFCHYTRKIESIIISKVIYFKDSLSFALLMFSGEFLGGLGVIFYQKLNFLNTNKQTKQDEIMVKVLTKGKGINKMSKKDNMFIIILLIFFAASFYFTKYSNAISNFRSTLIHNSNYYIFSPLYMCFKI